MTTIAVIGLWHQGVVAAACLAELGFTVIAADADAQRIDALRKGRPPLYEPGLEELVGKGLASARLSFTTDYAAAVRAARFVFMMFDTTVDDDDRSDLSEVFRAFEAFAPALRPDAVIWVTAQIPVGTCDELMAVGRKFGMPATVRIAYSPENLRLGQAIERFRAPPLPVIGSDDQSALDELTHLLAPLSTEWRRVNLRTAEMMKHALNGFLAVCVCFANELGNLCDEVGADGKKIGELLRLEPRVGPRAMLMPGLGFAGGTLARDMQTLRSIGDGHNLETLLLDGAWHSNIAQNELVLRKLKRVLGEIRGTRVAVLGLTYKPDTSTLRRSASLAVIADLVEAGASVSAHDPQADREELASYHGFTVHDVAYEALHGAQALVLMTPWPEYRDLDFGQIRPMMKHPYVFDSAGLWDGAALTALGFTYEAIGRGRRTEGAS
jgi:UDPglucose 6-dehydrogenase